jgi:hypothetical protein
MIVLRILLGLLKGAIVGGGIGAGFYLLDPGGGSLAWARWPVYGAIGFLTGVVCGKPPWAKGAAWVASILKAALGFGLAVGLFFLADFLLRFQVFGRVPTMWPFAFGAAIGVLYGVWVEVDDGGKSDDEGRKKLPAKPDTRKLPVPEEHEALPAADDEHPE